jgi:predicted ribosomally synthesized peptide with nif11-like leader
MSREAARAFIERMKTDETFRREVLAQEDAEARIRFVSAAGFDCTGEEFEPPGDGALTDEEMAWASGGVGPSEEEPWNPGHYPLATR